MTPKIMISKGSLTCLFHGTPRPPEPPNKFKEPESGGCSSGGEDSLPLCKHLGGPGAGSDSGGWSGPGVGISQRKVQGNLQ